MTKYITYTAKLSKKLQKKPQKIHENLLKFGIWSGAKVCNLVDLENAEN